jgi:hypothetical protein
MSAADLCTTLHRQRGQGGGEGRDPRSRHTSARPSWGFWANTLTWWICQLPWKHNVWAARVAPSRSMLPQRALSEGGVECALATSAAAFSNGYVSVPPLWFRSTSNPLTTRRAGAPSRRPWANSQARRRRFIRDQLTGRPLSWRAAAAPRRVAANIGAESPGPLAPERRVTMRPTAWLPPLSWGAMAAPCQTVATRWR